MNLKPIFYIVIAILFAIFLFKCSTKSKPILIEKITHRTVVDTIKYPEYIEIEKPVIVTRENKVYLTNKKQIDSLISHYEQELAVCSRNYNNALAQLYDASVGDTIIDEKEIKLYAGVNKGENYKLSWQIGTIGELSHFHPTIEVTSSTKTIDATKKHAIGLHLGLFADTKLNVSPVIGIGYEKGWLGLNAAFVTNQKAIMVTLNPKIRW